MRLVTKQEDVIPLFKQAQQEAEAAFGNGSVYIERSVREARNFGGAICQCGAARKSMQRSSDATVRSSVMAGNELATWVASSGCLATHMLTELAVCSPVCRFVQNPRHIEFQVCS
jgi:acetyl/propionyl-CoA carboxylase alpha subunit